MSFDKVTAIVTGLKMLMEEVGSNAEIWGQIGTFKKGWVQGNMEVGLEFEARDGFLDTLGRNGFDVDAPYEAFNTSDHRHSARQITETSWDPGLHFVQQNNYPKSRFDAHFDMRSSAFRTQTVPDIQLSPTSPPVFGSGRIAEMAAAGSSHFDHYSIYEIRLQIRNRAANKPKNK